MDFKILLCKSIFRSVLYDIIDQSLGTVDSEPCIEFRRSFRRSITGYMKLLDLIGRIAVDLVYRIKDLSESDLIVED